MSEFKPGDKVWHPKTKLFGPIIAIEGMTESIEISASWQKITFDAPVPTGHVVIGVNDPVATASGNGMNYFTPFTWSIDSIEKMDEEEFKLTALLVKWKLEKTRINKLKDEAGKEYAAAEEAMLEYLMRMAQQGTRQYAGIGQVTIDGKNIHASITEENKEIAFKEIEDMGRGEIIKRSVHPSTLEAFVSELQDSGIAVPKHISVYETPKLSFAKKK